MITLARGRREFRRVLRILTFCLVAHPALAQEELPATPPPDSPQTAEAPPPLETPPAQVLDELEARGRATDPGPAGPGEGEWDPENRPWIPQQDPANPGEPGDTTMAQPPEAPPSVDPTGSILLDPQGGYIAVPPNPATPLAKVSEEPTTGLIQADFGMGQTPLLTREQGRQLMTDPEFRPPRTTDI